MQLNSKHLKHNSISDIYDIMRQRNEFSAEIRMFWSLLDSELLSIFIEDDTINDLDKSKAVKLKLSNIQHSLYGDAPNKNLIVNIIQGYGSIHSPIRIAIKKGLAKTADVLMNAGGGTKQFLRPVCTQHHHATEITKLIYESERSDDLSHSLPALELARTANRHVYDLP